MADASNKLEGGYNHESATRFARHCVGFLKDRIDDGNPITVNTIAWGDGHFTVTAFHTVWCETERDNFAREVVEYKSITGETVHLVRHYHTGHHEEHTDHELEIVERIEP